jgi:hypothetical protein
VSRITVRLAPTKLSDSVLFSDKFTFVAGTGLDSSEVRPDNSHCPVLTVEECWKTRTHNPKTDIVVAVGGRFVVAVGSATVRGIIDPGTATFTYACPNTYYTP